MKTTKTIEKTLEWIMVDANVFALVAFIVEICQGCKEVPTVLAISWCLNTLICFLGWMKAMDKYRKLKESTFKVEKTLTSLPKWIKAEDSDGNLTSHYLVFNMADNVIYYRNAWKNEDLVRIEGDETVEVLEAMADWCRENGYMEEK